MLACRALFSKCIFFLTRRRLHSLLFFFNDTATTEIYTLSLHDALPISGQHAGPQCELRTDPAHPQRLATRSEEHTSELQSHSDLVCRLLLEKKKKLEIYTRLVGQNKNRGGRTRKPIQTSQ